METQERFFWGALLGTALGAATALIFAPMSGQRMRQKIADELQGSPRQTRRQNRHATRRASITARSSHSAQPGSQRPHSSEGHGENKEKSATKRAEAKTPRKSASIGLKVQAHKS